MNTKINEGVFDTFPELSTTRLRFRRFEKSDVAALFKLRTDAKVMQYLDSKKLENETEAIRMIRQMHKDFKKREGISWAITLANSGKIIGYVGFWRLIKTHVRAEIGYLLHPDFWQQGLMTEALKKAIDFAFFELQVHSIEANVNPDNLASRKLLEKLGFEKEAYFKENYFFDGRFTDSVIYSLLE